MTYQVVIWSFVFDRFELDEIRTIRTDLPSPEEVAPRLLSDTRSCWSPSRTQRPFSAPVIPSKYHAPKLVEAWSSGRALTSDHVSPIVQSARLVLQRRDDLERNKEVSRLLTSYERNRDVLRRGTHGDTRCKSGSDVIKHLGGSKSSSNSSSQSGSNISIDDKSELDKNVMCTRKTKHSESECGLFAPRLNPKNQTRRLSGWPNGVFLTETQDYCGTPNYDTKRSQSNCTNK